MSQTPTPKQALILWCLLGKHGSALQSEVVPKVDAADRRALVSGRYLSEEKQGRSIRLTVTDGGWNWAGQHLRDPLPANFRVLQDWLERIDRHLATTGETLAGLIGTPATPGPRPAESPSAESLPAKPTRSRTAKAAPPGSAKPRKLTKKQVRARIEAAYLALTEGQKAQAVRLSALRAHLSELDRATVDAGLAAILAGDPTARLSQLSDPKSLSADEREAAFSPAGEPFHIIWIQS
jgi:hypothetical protein